MLPEYTYSVGAADRNLTFLYQNMVAEFGAIIANLANIPKFGGSIWYVDAAKGNDNNSGDRLYPFKTIGAGISAMSDGDAINVKAGTYRETDLELSNTAAEIWFEIGVTVDPANNTALTVSGASCRVRGEALFTPAAGEIGILVSGNECVIEAAKVMNGATSIRVTGQGVVLNGCACGFPTTAAYDLRGAQGRAFQCKTVGNAATIGYWINNGSDTGVLEDCTSAGHTTSGFSIGTGSVNWTILRCSSGGGDGRWIDVDHANIWSEFSYAKELHKELTLNNGGAATFTANLFLVTGTIQINYIYGVVETAISNDVDVVYLDLFPTGGAAIEITDNAGAVLDSIKAGSLISKQGLATAVLNVVDSNLGFVDEYVGNFKNSLKPFVVGKKDGAVTHIRLVYDTGGGATGVIHWHVDWAPLSDDGFLAVV